MLTVLEQGDTIVSLVGHEFTLQCHMREDPFLVPILIATLAVLDGFGTEVTGLDSPPKLPCLLDRESGLSPAFFNFKRDG
jgi:hypothetical protein